MSKSNVFERIWKYLRCCNEDDRSNSCSVSFNYLRLVNKPISFERIDTKTLEEETNELGEDVSLPVEQGKNYDKICFRCEMVENLTRIECRHFVCRECINTILRRTCSLKELKVLRCKCGQVIKSKIFQDIVSEENLIYYLDNAKRETGKVICEICGFSHSDYSSCSEFFLENKLKKKCCKCSKEEEYLLPCTHSYCGECLRELINDCLNTEDSRNAYCVICEDRKTAIPVWMMQNCFGSSFKSIKKNFEEEQIECSLCKKIGGISSCLQLQCGEKFCKKCLGVYIEDKICNFKVKENEIVCPICSLKIDEDVIQETVKPSVYNTYLEVCIKEIRLHSKI